MSLATRPQRPSGLRSRSLNCFDHKKTMRRCRGMNPDLADRPPALLVREQMDNVAQAARGFLSYEPEPSSQRGCGRRFWARLNLVGQPD